MLAVSLICLHDTFPTAMHIASVMEIREMLFPAIDGLIATFKKLEKDNRGIVTTGRTHLQDAVPIAFSQEISGWRNMLEKSKQDIMLAEKGLCELALGGTAVGTGLNAPKDFDVTVAGYVKENTGIPFVTAKNKFHALTSLDDMVFAHGIEVKSKRMPGFIGFENLRIPFFVYLSEDYRTKFPETAQVLKCHASF